MIQVYLWDSSRITSNYYQYAKQMKPRTTLRISRSSRLQFFTATTVLTLSHFRTERNVSHVLRKVRDRNLFREKQKVKIFKIIAICFEFATL